MVEGGRSWWWWGQRGGVTEMFRPDPLLFVSLQVSKYQRGSGAFDEGDERKWTDLTSSKLHPAAPPTPTARSGFPRRVELGLDGQVSG